jgi:uncharacterized protein DUF3658
LWLTIRNPAKYEAGGIRFMNRGSDDYIDGLILSTVVSQWRKVALVVGKVHTACRDNAPEIDEYDIAARIRALVDEGRLEAQGNLYFWRLSEVRLPEAL